MKGNGGAVAVLSDGEIRDLITNNQMITNAVDANIFACSYQFRPGVIVSTGSDSAPESVRDWTASTVASDVYRIKPGELIWVRTVERVAMPDDICAFWWQTNRLSRQGLMLVNMSMVEPGYHGPLACLFVNFGREAVPLRPDTVIAKLVFNRMGAPAERPLAMDPTTLEYDRDLILAAMNAPVTFLDVGAFDTSLNDKRDSAITEMGQALDSFKKQLGDEAESVKKDTQSQFQKDANSLIRRVLGAAAIGFALVILALTFVPWLQANVQPNLSTQIQEQVNNALTQRLISSTSLSQAQQVATLQREVQQLERELSSLRGSAAAPPK
jgi:deoxycytidine triphosphate deaminase